MWPRIVELPARAIQDRAARAAHPLIVEKQAHTEGKAEVSEASWRDDPHVQCSNRLDIGVHSVDREAGMKTQIAEIDAETFSSRKSRRVVIARAEIIDVGGDGAGTADGATPKAKCIGWAR